MLGVEKGKVVLANYTEEWKKEYKREFDKLENLIGKYVIKIEHVGSTSIFGMKAKPIIDIAVVVNNFENINEYVEILKKAGYGYRDDNGEKGEYLFEKIENGLTTHLIHIIEKDSERWYNFILFKNYFINNPEKIEEYICLKEKIAEKYKGDRKSYTSNKEKYIKNIIEMEKQKLGM